MVKKYFCHVRGIEFKRMKIDFERVSVIGKISPLYSIEFWAWCCSAVGFFITAGNFPALHLLAWSLLGISVSFKYPSKQFLILEKNQSISIGWTLYVVTRTNKCVQEISIKENFFVRSRYTSVSRIVGCGSILLNMQESKKSVTIHGVLNSCNAARRLEDFNGVLRKGNIFC